MSDPIRKRFSANLDVNEGERAVTAWITTDSIDRDGDVMLPKGADLKDFAKSPTVFFNHNYDLPIGKTVALKRTDHGIQAKTVFAKRPESHEGEWLPDTVFSLFQQGVIKGFSIGFQPMKGHPASDEDKIKFGDGVQYVFDGWKLLEYSVAPLPANQDALAEAVSKGVISKSAADAVIEAQDDDGDEDDDTKSVTDDGVELVIEDTVAKSDNEPVDEQDDAPAPDPEPLKTPRLNARRIVQRMMQLNELKK